jgi:hypothetical protein
LRITYEYIYHIVYDSNVLLISYYAFVYRKLNAINRMGVSKYPVALCEDVCTVA